MSVRLSVPCHEAIRDHSEEPESNQRALRALHSVSYSVIQSEPKILRLVKV